MRSPSLSKKKVEQHGDDQTGEDLAEHDGAALQAAGQRAAVGAQARDAGVDGFVELAAADVERRVGEHVGGLADALLGLRAQVAELIGDRRRECGRQRRDHHDGEDHRPGGGQAVRHAAAPHPAHKRQQQRAGQQRDDHRKHDDAQVDQRV